MPNLTAEQSKRALADALLTLLETEPFAKITVSEIAGRAGLARLTFYRHFDSKETLLEWHLQRLFETYLEEHDETDAPTLEDALTLCFVYWQRNAAILHALSQNGLEHLLASPFDAYIVTMLDRYEAHTLSTVQIRFLAGGLSFAMLQWIEGRPSKKDARAAAREILALIDLNSLLPGASASA